MYRICVTAYRDRGLGRMTGRQRGGGEREREREKTSKTQGDYASAIREVLCK